MSGSKRVLLSGTALAFLAACGSSGSSVSRGIVSISPAEEATRTFAQVDADTQQDAGGAIADGQTLTARSVGVAGLSLNYGNGDTGLADAAVSVVRNADGELTVTLNGVEQAFTTADRFVEDDGTVFGYDIADDANSVYVSAFSQTGELNEFLNPGRGYAEVLSVQSNQVPGGADLRAYAVLGAETRDEALASLPTATYNGRARLDAVPDTGFVNNGTSRTRVRGDVTMMADFGAGTINGTLSDITTQTGDDGLELSIAGSVAMNTARFNVNGFRSSLTGDSTLAASGLTLGSGSTYSGAFYGPAAEEVGGVLSATGTFEGENYNAVGFFVADQYD